jgi:hypothetical protein
MTTTNMYICIIICYMYVKTIKILCMWTCYMYFYASIVRPGLGPVRLFRIGPNPDGTDWPSSNPARREFCCSVGPACGRLGIETTRLQTICSLPQPSSNPVRTLLERILFATTARDEVWIGRDRDRVNQGDPLVPGLVSLLVWNCSQGTERGLRALSMTWSLEGVREIPVRDGDIVHSYPTSDWDLSAWETLWELISKHTGSRSIVEL